MKECLKKCKKANSPCQVSDCRMWIKFEKEYNCALETVDKNGSLTLREVADRLGVSFVRIKQIEEAALKKIRKKAKNKSIYLE